MYIFKKGLNVAGNPHKVMRKNRIYLIHFNKNNTSETRATVYIKSEYR